MSVFFTHSAAADVEVASLEGVSFGTPMRSTPQDSLALGPTQDFDLSGEAFSPFIARPSEGHFISDDPRDPLKFYWSAPQESVAQLLPDPLWEFWAIREPIAA